jgi:16S rRNA (uracil1498-N3)-methyltransferase
VARFFCPAPLTVGASLDLPSETVRHIQVMRLQPGKHVTLFDGLGGEYSACIVAMTRNSVHASIDTHESIERESPVVSQLVIGMPANERMDWLVEKATELGVSRITPLMTAHGVLRLSPERALKRQLHWQGIAQSACAQSGRNTLPRIDVPQSWGEWVGALSASPLQHKWVLSLGAQAAPLPVLNLSEKPSVALLIGPEGGLSREEESQSIELGFIPVSLGARVLRAETAPLAVLSGWL